MTGEGTLGASGWEHVVPFGGGVDDSYRTIREEVFRSDDYLWNYDMKGFVDDEADAVRPTSLAALDRFKQEVEEFWDEGTHSILDTDRIVPASGSDEEGAIRPLTDAETQRWFGTVTPSRADFDRAYDGGSGPLADSNPLRWSGRCAVLHDGSTPAEVAFWGFSGD